MKRILLLGVLAALTVGCSSFKPVGPIIGKNAPSRSATQPNTVVTTPKDIGAMPTFADAPAPPAPTRNVVPGDVTADGANDAAKKLMLELEQDRKAVAAMPNYTEVSHVPRNGR